MKINIRGHLDHLVLMCQMLNVSLANSCKSVPRTLRGIFLISIVAMTLAKPSQASNLPPLQTVFIILMENNNWSNIIGNASAPYINNTLLPMASYCTQYYNPPGNHPSLPNYLWLEAGTNFGIKNDGEPGTNSVNTTNHLVTLLKNANISWKTYQESISGTNVPLSTSGDYAARHNPFVYFDDITGTNNPNYAYGIAHIRPFTELAGDLASNTVARYNFITPNVCDDMHSSCAPLTNAVLQGDNWLAAEVPMILNSSAYTNGGVIFITWDEGEGDDGPIGMIVLSKLAWGGGYHNYIHYTHSSTLRTFQEIFGVTPLLGDAANATDLSDLFVHFSIRNITKAPGGAVLLSVGGLTAGKTYEVQMSTNLINWSGIGTNTVSTNNFNFTNTPGTNGRETFYRVMQR